MQWLTENWVFLLIGAAFVAMHLFGHRGHGGHGGHGRRDDEDREGRRDDSAARGAHRH
jgi:hypothetical protein